jgi:hypothetical protein
MRKEPIVVAAVLFVLAVAAFLMAWLQHDKLVNAEVPYMLSVKLRP